MNSQINIKVLILQHPSWYIYVPPVPNGLIQCANELCALNDSFEVVNVIEISANIFVGLILPSSLRVVTLFDNVNILGQLFHFI